jgi:hypothetical protein
MDSAWQIRLVPIEQVDHANHLVNCIQKGHTLGEFLFRHEWRLCSLPGGIHGLYVTVTGYAFGGILSIHGKRRRVNIWLDLMLRCGSEPIGVETNHRI